MPDTEQDSLSSLYRTLVDNARDVITLIDEHGVIKFQSPSVERQFGYSPGELVGQNVFDLVHEDDISNALEDLQKVAMGDQDDTPTMVRFRHKNQTWRYVEVVGQVLNGDISGVVLNTRDITEQQETLIDHRTSEESFQAAFNATSTISTISIPDTGELINVNDSWVKTLGWSRAEGIGKTAIELNIWGSEQNRELAMNELQRKGKLRQYKADIYTKTGERRTVLIDAEYLYLEENTQMFISCVDITEQEKIEEQLRQSQKIEAVGQLTGGIAHDFNNLLSVILGHADLASVGAAKNSELSHSLEAIIRSAETGAELIQQLLSFSRKQKLNPESFILSECIAGMQTLLQTSVGKDVEIRIEAGDDNWLCHLDPIQLESAMLNMAINARDAMPNGGYLKFLISEISLDAPKAQLLDLQPGDYVQLDIADNGKGMPPEIVEHAFEPFFTTKTAERGTGLGLSMVYGFVKQSGGHVSIKSDRRGGGTTITLLLPRGEAQSQVVHHQTEHGIREQKNKRVLLVEDDDNVRLLVAKLLGSLKLEVLEASNGEEAEHLMAEPLDLLVSDVMLPGGARGPDIARKLRTFQPQVAVLYMSGFHPGVLSPDDLAHKGVDFIQKPFSRDEFSSRIQALFHN
jgi:PAS domain S-box-containing protein